MLRIDIQTVRHDATLRCSGRLVLGLEVEALRCMAMSRPERSIRLDLRDVHAIDAAGLGALVDVQCWAHKRGKALTIVSPSGIVRRLIALTWLHLVLAVADSPDAGTEVESERDLTERALTA